MRQVFRWSEATQMSVSSSSFFERHLWQRQYERLFDQCSSLSCDLINSVKWITTLALEAFQIRHKSIPRAYRMAEREVRFVVARKDLEGNIRNQNLCNREVISSTVQQFAFDNNYYVISRETVRNSHRIEDGPNSITQRAAIGTI